eukprot:TRINITY_DN4145_c0_g2_i1.p1 TRINITY_DN4145_c0_g2~~TRINITY_DN4145_c0_g2_i1.p1  ORF type:complete len:282 (+),score=35.32 TRINITY_DN4145_c0_g2_i1:58-903(+)
MQPVDLLQWQNDLQKRGEELERRETAVRSKELVSRTNERVQDMDKIRQADQGGGVEVVVRRHISEGLGCLIDDENILHGVRTGTPADKAGAGGCIGRRLTHVDGVQLPYGDDPSMAMGTTVILRFSVYPPPSPVPVINGAGYTPQASSPLRSSGVTKNIKKCGYCGVEDTDYWCPCHTVSYCSQGCQVRHWNAHSQTCTSVGKFSAPKKYASPPPPTASSPLQIGRNRFIPSQASPRHVHRIPPVPAFVLPQKHVESQLASPRPEMNFRRSPGAASQRMEF